MINEHGMLEFDPPSKFRVWLGNKWVEHKDELFTWENRLPEYDDKYYFRKHKWMLKRMFQEEIKNV